MRDINLCGLLTMAVREIAEYLANTGCTTKGIQKLLWEVCRKSFRFAVK